MRSLGLSTIVAVLAFVASCASAPKPPPPPPPAPAPVAAPAPATVVPKPTTVLVKRRPPAPPLASAGVTNSITFDGSIFALQYHGDDNGVALREYFLPNESGKAWTRLVELLVYPTAGKGLTTAAYATQVADGYKATYPYANYEVLSNKDGSSTLDFIAWDDAALKAHYLIYNVFKFFPAQKGGNLVGFHFVEKIYTDPKATSEQNSDNTEAIKQKVMLELSKVPSYRE